MTPAEWHETVVAWRRRIDEALDRRMPPESEPPELLHRAMRYSLFAGGKRLRPILCLLSCEAAGGRPETALTPAAAIELLHTYTLIHDDLPAMDNDRLRRGQPTVWVKYGEAMAILAGDALFAKAFELLTEQARLSPPERVVQVIERIAQASGVHGMCGGQVEDILCEGQTVSAEQLRFIHTHKTGALIRASVLSGALLMGADKPICDALDAYSRALGLAFQIADDLLDETESTEQMGKPAGSDRAHGKATYPALFGIDAARAHAQHAMQEAIDALQPFDTRAGPLRWLATFAVERRR